VIKTVYLPESHRWSESRIYFIVALRGLRLAMLVVATLFYGFFSGWLVIVHVEGYLAQP
jgi:hypothetical protein